MCGRFGIALLAEDIAELVDVPLKDLEGYEPRWNIAPTQDSFVVRLDHGQRRAVPMRWGLVPSWAKDRKIGHRLMRRVSIRGITGRRAGARAVVVGSIANDRGWVVAPMRSLGGDRGVSDVDRVAPFMPRA
ncbi:MAG: SOS response-associated peptidase family protein [Myxococcota bacterium]